MRNQDRLMSPDYFINLFDYDSAVNRKLLAVLGDSPKTSERALSTFAHLLTAKKIWMTRLNGGLPNIPVWPTFDIDECKDLIEKNREAYRSYLLHKSEADLISEIRYQNSKGVEFRNQVRDILMHVLIHGGYHRGQVAQSIRQAGGEPITTDYIFHLRE